MRRVDNTIMVQTMVIKQSHTAHQMIRKDKKKKKKGSWKLFHDRSQSFLTYQTQIILSFQKLMN